MSELSFAQSFLTTLSTRPSKLSSSHVEDPHTYPARGALILPKTSHPFPKRQKLTPPGAERTISVSLRSLRNPPLDITLPSQSLLTSILDLKSAVAERASIPIAKLRILYNKKPVNDAKVLKELLGDSDDVTATASKIEFAVMVMGGAASVVKQEEKEVKETGEEKDEVLPSVKVIGLSGAEVLRTEVFWADLTGFLTQRLRDEAEGERLGRLFREAWQGSGGDHDTSVRE